MISPFLLSHNLPHRHLRGLREQDQYFHIYQNKSISNPEERHTEQY